MQEEPRDDAQDEQPEEGAPEAPGPEVEGADELSAAAEGAAESEEPPAEEEPAAEEAPAAAGEEEPAADEAEEPAAEEAPAAEGEEAPAAAAEEAPRQRRRDRKGEDKQEEVIPGAHLEPDLVLEEERREEGEFGEYQAAEALAESPEAVGETEEDQEEAEPGPVAHKPLDLAADARYHATGKRKTAVARVILKPGEGTYTINGRHLDEFFPRVRLQRVARQPLEATGYQNRMDVIARIHGGGVSAQAGALRHGIARALVEADPNLRSELKRRGYLTRDPRQKERKKAGLKKARKRPQFSKR